MHHFLANFEKLVQKIQISGNGLQFPEIPIKISEIFTKKSAISVHLQQHFEKICKDHLNVRKSENFEMQAVQKSVFLVELEKCCKM